MRRIIADTNSFLRLLIDDIPQQKKAFTKLLKKGKDREILIFVPQIIVFEIEYILRKYYQVPKDKIIEKLQTIVTMYFLEIEDRQSFIMALDFYLKHSISFADCFILARSKIEEYELFTFDKKLSKLAL